MANQDGFDFEALKALNLAKYIKQHCRLMQVKKAQAGIVLSDYKLKGVKQACVFLPFKKMKEAEVIFKQIKTNKEHILKKVALVHVNVGKQDIGFSIKKGGMTTSDIKLKGDTFFQSNFKLAIKAAEEAVENVASVAEEVATKDSSGEQPKKMTAEKRAKVKSNINAMDSELAKISKALKLD